MKLVILYGPPASGKLTVAKELSKATGFRIFHNHVTRDIVSLVMDQKDRRFQPLVDKYRLEIIGLAAKERVEGLIFTFVYVRKKGDDEFVRKVIRLVNNHKGSVCFVQISCEGRELMRRVSLGSRKKYRKIGTRAELKRVLDDENMVLPINFVRSLKIDTTTVAPKDAALKIKKHYGL